jgi:L-cysteine:1D-myo-inositol 2-amino-2-deoxy-alpha-D-glucopyranoside ligase
MQLYCTKARQLVPLPASQPLNIYVCGITPYDSMHIGHIAMLLTYDVLIRRVRSLDKSVRMVRNITDVDDPLLPKALELGVEYWDLVEREITQFNSDARTLQLVTADAEPRASDHIDGIVEMIQELLSSDVAYLLGEHIYFSIESDPYFGSLSQLTREQMIDRSRDNGGDPDRPGKKDPLDFILWQPSRAGEPVYETELGAGRPGWHIGCSVMSRAHLSRRIDIHGGGQDLVYPHHECEMAQNRAARGGSEVAVWVHANLVGYQGHKMSKSRGNFVLARDVLREYDPRALRLSILTHYHHRYEFEWQDGLLDQAVGLLGRLTEAARAGTGPSIAAHAREFRARIDDDLDFPGAVKILSQCADLIEAGGGDQETGTTLADMGRLLGLDLTQ